MKLSVVIVSYNVKGLLRNCLQSVARATGEIEAEVIIIDNGSTDGSVEELQHLFPSFLFLPGNTNLGFAKACNMGAARSHGDFVLYLNPDTEVPPDCFTKCLSFMGTHPEAGALGVRMVDADGNFLRESKRGFPTPMTSFWKLSGLSAIFPRSKLFSRYYLGHLDEHAVSQVDILCGAFMFVHREAVRKTGGFDERFFMYAEDIDLSHRIILAGYRNYYFPETTILHHKGGSTKKDGRYVKQFYRAMSQFARKYYGRGAFYYLLNAAIWLRAGIEFVRPSKK